MKFQTPFSISSETREKIKEKGRCCAIWAVLPIVILLVIVIVISCKWDDIKKLHEKHKTSSTPTTTDDITTNTTIPVDPTNNDNNNDPTKNSSTCTIVPKVSYTFYGYPDNDPPGADIMHDCGRGTSAGGIGTFANPLTMATAPGELNNCEVVYSPYLRKYLINEDYCEQCKTDWVSHIWHVDIWLGGNSTTQGTEQLDCEGKLTPAEESQVVVRDPSKDLPVDASVFYTPGDKAACNTASTYLDVVVKDYC
ncbi:hypothetical protein P168DRAFT_326164 [Aspergillus campestris IBT 28561]|uniref:Uncharacterized protein n=1 Tax=Aspergillus campestris (strain IBT 28561) TaxID=1392248 RepID=A0A2I1D7L3_ASPC2|nr:uncharacterized protein P168DRAFT_326164 [Aspergillus campestris IBT 28561]PKY05859.1 hypothetical protein P168DRAFT_326164 [Aspergillus campestris IBT 28561]